MAEGSALIPSSAPSGACLDGPGVADPEGKRSYAANGRSTISRPCRLCARGRHRIAETPEGQFWKRRLRGARRARFRLQLDAPKARFGWLQPSDCRPCVRSRSDFPSRARNRLPISVLTVSLGKRRDHLPSHDADARSSIMAL
jgi:hypothetical protein